MPNGFTVLESAQLLASETFHDILQPRFGEDNIQPQYTDADSFVLCFDPENKVTVLSNLLKKVIIAILVT